MVGHVFFMGAFFSVLATIVTTVVAASIRTGRDCQARKVERLRWEGDFHDLPQRDRACRHELTGEFKHRTCQRRFECHECETHAELLAEHPVAADESDRMYHRGHTWARWEGDGTVTVGLDEIGRRLLGVPDVLELPAEGSHMEVNGTAWRMQKCGASVRVLSPVEGTVVATADPESDWYLKVRPTDTRTTHLLSGAEVEPWIRREMEKLQSLTGGAGLRPDDKRWDTVLGEMFLNG